MIMSEEIKTKDFSITISATMGKLNYLSRYLWDQDDFELDKKQLQGISYILRDVCYDLGVIHNTLYDTRRDELWCSIRHSERIIIAGMSDYVIFKFRKETQGKKYPHIIK